MLVPVKAPKGGCELDPDAGTYHTLLRALRCLGERGSPLLVTRWKFRRVSDDSLAFAFPVPT
ncbi:MAG TPA: hypothetical protein VFU74_20140 [Actinocrinis sp.]|nr:hypothetical protein [Actinocrinis sp.]